MSDARDGLLARLKTGRSIRTNSMAGLITDVGPSHALHYEAVASIFQSSHSLDYSTKRLINQGFFAGHQRDGKGIDILRFLVIPEPISAA